MQSLFTVYLEGFLRMMSICYHHTGRAELNAPIDVCLVYNQQACTASTQQNTDKNRL